MHLKYEFLVYHMVKKKKKNWNMQNVFTCQQKHFSYIFRYKFWDPQMFSPPLNNILLFKLLRQIYVYIYV